MSDKEGKQASHVRRKVMLISIDGWGISDQVKGNAVKAAKTPTIDYLEKHALHTLIRAHGLDVGLPDGVMGNSEVGHLTMGSGRVEFQDLVRINLTIKNGTFGKQPALVEAMEHAVKGNGRFHLMGLVSDGGVHSHIDHLEELLRVLKANKVPNTYVHFFADGRDTPPDSGVKYLKQLQGFIGELGYGSIATLMGRYYAMDRDKRWERIQVAYDALLDGKGEHVKPADLVAAVQKRYEAKENDEFLKPFIVDESGLVKDGDTILFFDFRSDRMRQICETLGRAPPFETKLRREKLHVVQYTQYDATFKLPIVFPPQDNTNVLAEWLAKHHLPQFHCAETEKYAHVTFFFNGGKEKANELEDRMLVPSPKVATYDLQPEMNMAGVCEKVVEAIGTEKYPFLVCNFAPPDMVGHTGMFDPTVKAVTGCDQVIGRIWEACKKHNYVLVVTADHGNAEEMIDELGNPKTAHTSNPVFLIIGNDPELEWTRKDGGLSDVAPTILCIMGLDKPKEMTGSSMVHIKKH